MKKVIFIVFIIIATLFIGNMFISGLNKESKNINIIIYSNRVMESEEVKAKLDKILDSYSDNIDITYINKEENKKFIVNLKSKINEEQIILDIRNEEWVEKAQINYEVKIN